MTIEQPFKLVSHEISTKTQLNKFLTSYATAAAESNKYYAVLVNDIDCADGNGAPTYVCWGRGAKDAYFYGTFDGQGYAIKNYKVQSGGLFGGLISTGVIKNVAFINAVGPEENSALVIGQIYGGKVENIYVKGTYSVATGYRGIAYAGGCGIFSNCIVDIDYPDGSTKTTNVFTGETGGNLASSMYGIGNATRLEPKKTTAPYASVADMLATNKDNIVSTNGWSEYWSFDKDGNLYFGDEKVAD